MRLLLYPDPGPRWRAALAGAAPGVELLVASDAVEATRLIAQADALFGNLTLAMLQAARQLRWVQTSMAGLERYMFPELVASSLTLTNARGIYSDVIADHVFACVLAFARDLPRLLRAQQERRWLREAQVQAFQLQGMTAGIVGFGGIGSEVARRAKVVDMAVLAVDPAPHAEVPGVVVWGPERFDDLLAGSDFVIVCAPETPETRGLFNAERFAKMKHGARFIKRCFTAEEQKTAKRRAPKGKHHAATYAKRFAAKEACAKALGLGLRHNISFRDMGVANDAAGRPVLKLTGGAQKRLKTLTPRGMKAIVHLSLSDEAPFAQAFVVIEAVEN